MNINKYNSIVQNAFAQNMFLKIVLVVMVVGNLFLGTGLTMALNSSRTILLPPTIEKSFWVDKDTASKEYLEEMALFIAQLELNVTPASYAFQSKTLLNYIHPSAHGKMQSKILADGEQLKKDNASTWFVPQNLRTDVKNKVVSVTGEFITTIAEKQVVKMQKTYNAKFEISGGRLYLTRFEDASDTENNNTAVQLDNTKKPEDKPNSGGV